MRYQTICFLLADCRIYLGDFNRKHFITAVDFTEVFSWLIRKIINISLSVCTKKLRVINVLNLNVVTTFHAENSYSL